MEDKDDSHSKDMPLMDNQKKREVTVTEEEGTGAGWSDKSQKEKGKGLSYNILLLGIYCSYNLELARFRAKKNTQKYLLDIRNKENPDIICLLETKQQNRKMHSILKSVNVHNYWLVPPRGQAGGMALIWKHNLTITIDSSTHNQINAIAKENCSNSLYMVSAFYSSPYPTNKQQSWDMLVSIAETITIHWLVMGDLNVVLSREEKKGSNLFDEGEATIFRNKISDMNLQDLGFKGYPYTWSNHRTDNSRVEKRLDRAMSNEKWIELFPKSTIHHLIARGSDHSPIIIKTNPIWKDGAYPFKTRYSRNRIESIKNPNGTWLEKISEISNCLTDHFKSISNNNSPVLNRDLINLIPSSITDRENELLLETPKDAEIKDTLFAMEGNKSLGSNGLPPNFFQDNWETIGEDLIKLVHNFFDTGYMLKEMNTTFISLIPKVQLPSTPGDFRPISLCNTTYKLISKRMKPLLCKIISPYQSALILGRQITDNTMVSHEIIHNMRTRRDLQEWMGIKIDMSKAFDRVE
ncbi:uncharacterized protein LOC113337670 [Papaver somniferum]|uniref:uncharacterized protein LOC113337670 n=1 Tax=Papaver somniferum TaxID=3469 RepID=UPI000E6F5020|nr:uncharacterized protein LOC113337670 [Papaver somniferum]